MGKIYTDWWGAGKKSIGWGEDGYYSLFFTFSFVGSATKHRVKITKTNVSWTLDASSNSCALLTLKSANSFNNGLESRLQERFLDGLLHNDAVQDSSVELQTSQDSI